MTLAEHWVGKELELLEGSLVLVGILEEARAAWLAMAATKAKVSYFLGIYTVEFVCSVNILNFIHMIIVEFFFFFIKNYGCK
jgi:hypothetical protein